MTSLFTQVDVPFKKTIPGQGLCAALAGVWQMTFGGIVLDTISTRLQAGFSLSQSLWGVTNQTTNASVLVNRYASANTVSALTTRARLLTRSNLYAGYVVVVAGRFPYLFINLGTYAQAENLIFSMTGGVRRQKTLKENLACILCSTTISSLVITAIECPKILDQLKGQKIMFDKDGKRLQTKRTTVTGVVRNHGFLRLMQGYDAMFMREFFFNCALLGAPPLAHYLHTTYVEPNVSTSAMARLIDGKELFLASLCMGIPIGFLTNAPDQLKTNIQKGQFRHIVQAFRHQIGPEGGGIMGLFGRAAVYRSMYITHGVVMLNLSRTYIEGMLERIFE